MKKKEHYECKECGFTSLKWYGKCPNCDTFNSMLLIKEEKKEINRNIKIYNLQTLNIKKNEYIKFHNPLFNRLFGNGLIKGAVILIAGSPGIGKSTFAMSLIKEIINKKILYVSGEETASQIKIRANRLKINSDVDLIISNYVEDIINNLSNKYEFAIIDSIQTVNSLKSRGVSGSPTMVRFVLEQLINKTKSINLPLIIIGHITKDGLIAGPKTLEHMVDSVYIMEKLKNSDIRIIKALKNRFGSIDEMLLFKMNEKGIIPIINPDSITIGNDNNPGKCISCTVKGSIPLGIEVQALASYSKYGMPQRIANGISIKRLQMLLGIMDKILDVNTGNMDIFVNISGGIELNDPLCDLAFVFAIFSSIYNITIPQNIGFLGEINLTGEIIGMSDIDIRIKHLKNIGINTLIIPENINIDHKDTVLKHIKNIKEVKDYGKQLGN